MAKISYLGEIIEDQPRRANGQWRKRASKIFVFFVCTVLGLGLAASYIYFNEWYEENINREVVVNNVFATPAFAEITMEAKVAALKEDILNRLMACESAGHTEEDGIIIFDANNAASIGQFQFQKKTVVHYYKEIYGQDITAKEAVIIALETSKARELAHDIIFKTKGGVWNWENCAKQTGIVSEIEVLKKLEQ